MPPSNPPRPPDPFDPRRRPPRPNGPGRLEGPAGPGRLEGPPPGAAPPPGGPSQRPAPAPRRPAPRSEKRSEKKKRPSEAPATARPPREAPLEDANGRSARRARARKRSRRRAIAIGAAIVLIAGGTAAFALSGGEGTETPTAHARLRKQPVTTTTQPAFEAFKTLTSNVPELSAFEQPVEGAPVISTFSKTTDYRQPRTLLAIAEQDGWYQALLPMRPNNTTGWVRAAEVTPGATDYEIRVSVSRYYVALFKAGELILEAPAAMGKAETPTPLGTFYVTDPVDLQSRPNGAYGAYALGLSGYSEVLKTFNGGPGQIALHGNGQQDTVGKNVSNGCIRLFNDVILTIAKTVPLGTPVTIEA